VEILFLFATEAEAGALRHSGAPASSVNTRFTVSSLVSGVGSVSTAWHFKNYLCAGNRPDLVINAGIAGSFRETLTPGAVVMPVSDIFADLGMEDENGFRHLSSTSLLNTGSYPFSGEKLLCRNRYTEKLSVIFKPADAITVNTVTGTEESVQRLRRLYDPDIETMEGAAVFYVCAMEKIPCVALRSVSNYAGPRSKGKWDTDKALKSLSDALNELLMIIPQE